jgi:hypothetical protein
MIDLRQRYGTCSTFTSGAGTVDISREAMADAQDRG